MWADEVGERPGDESSHDLAKRREVSCPNMRGENLSLDEASENFGGESHVTDDSFLQGAFLFMNRAQGAPPFKNTAPSGCSASDS
ncbi:uncharacterized protein G2W53_013933 [Senna tora]|uniref:Uncharacterized protein n=1 Tax=Senna tora TaxID=362788 RepID=A0A834TZU1_9FABA|nr:uncharacterized protein G2W53_013933 [Senna tora]